MSVFAERGMKVSARRLRETAIAKGACRKLGNAILILPEHLDLIFEEPEPFSRQRENPHEQSYRPANATELALRHLDKLGKRKSSRRG